jgi:hypothetical protein
MPLNLKVSEYAPDLPPLGPGSALVKNVIPRTPLSYGPMSSLAVFSNALAARCQGAIAGVDSGGNVTAYAGDATDLYALTPDSISWSVVSSSAGAYATPADGLWQFVTFQGQVIATNFINPIQMTLLGSGSNFADLSSDAPKARYVAGVKGWLFTGNTSDPTDGEQPYRVWWSGLNDATNWPTPGTAAAAEVQSDFNDFSGDSGWLQGIVGNLGTADCGIFFEHAVWRGVYVGPPAVFDFFPAQGVRGTPAPNSIVQLGSLVYFLAEDGFYVFDGTNSIPIGANKIDKTFYADLDQSHMDRICGTVDPINKLIFWAYPGSGSQSGNPNKLLIFNWQLNRWSFAELTLEFLFRSLSFGYTLDQLDAFGTLDTIVPALDSRIWTGGKVLLSAFDTDHKLNYFTGSNLAPTVDTTEVQVFPAQRALITNVRPLVDGGTPSVAFGVRDRLEDASTLGAATAMNSIGTCPQRASGRYVYAEVTLPAASSFSHIQGVSSSDEDVTPAGSR